MRLKKISNEVYLVDEPIVKIGREEIELLKKSVWTTPRGRVRICAHQDSSDLLHEMIIALAQSTYIRPHKHLKKSESFHIIEGEVDVVVFDDEGNIIEVIELGDLNSGKKFYYRLATPQFHTLIIHSDPLVIHETTNGPFKKGDAIFAPWTPEERNLLAGHRYIKSLSKFVRTLLSETQTP